MGISIWQVGIILLIVILVFGTKKLRNIGGDLGGALKGFKKAMSDDEPSSTQQNDADFDAVEDKATSAKKVEQGSVDKQSAEKQKAEKD